MMKRLLTLILCIGLIVGLIGVAAKKCPYSSGRNAHYTYGSLSFSCPSGTHQVEAKYIIRCSQDGTVRAYKITDQTKVKQWDLI